MTKEPRPLDDDYAQGRDLATTRAEIDPSAWVTWWAARSGGADNQQYFALMHKKGALLAEDFEQIGKWKEGCLKPGNGRWKTGTPTAYDVWMQAKARLPECPDTTGITAFLMDWSERTFAAARIKEENGSGSHEQRPCCISSASASTRSSTQGS